MSIMKKEYRNPVVDVLECMTEQMIAASGVDSNNGIGYGGIDNDGSINAETRMISNDFLYD